MHLKRNMLHNSQECDKLDVDLTQGRHLMALAILITSDIRREFLSVKAVLVAST
jgi:hypothetical protein